MTAPPGRTRRGRPPKLGEDQLQAVLDALTAGATLADAAAHVGVTRATLHNIRAHDLAFGRAVAAILQRRRAARQAACPACGRAALVLTPGGARCSACRTAFLLTATPAAPASGTVHTLAPPQPLAHAG